MLKGFVCQSLAFGLLLASCSAQQPLMTVHSLYHVLVHDPAGDFVYVNGSSIRLDRSAQLVISGQFRTTSKEKPDQVQRVLVYERKPPANDPSCQEQSCWTLLRQFSNFESASFTDEIRVSDLDDLMVIRFVPVIEAKRGGQAGPMEVLRDDGSAYPPNALIQANSLRLRGGELSMEINPTGVQ